MNDSTTVRRHGESLLDGDVHRGRTVVPARGQAGGLGDPALERLCLRALVAGAVVVGVVLATGHVAAAATGGGWPRYNLTDTPAIVWRVGTDLGDPGNAWDPVNRGTPVPGPAAWWSAFVVIAAAVAALVAVVVNAGRSRRQECSE